MRPPEFKEQPSYNSFEAEGLKRGRFFVENETAYQKVHITKPRTLGFAMHDSPVGMLAWMADKLFVWTDSYPWTPAEIITWTLLHYFPGPTTGFAMYRENMTPFFVLSPEAIQSNYIKAPTGMSMFAKELTPVPRAWAETLNNIVFWRAHTSGGHFAAYERPKQLAEDVIEFVKANWKESGGSVL